MIDDIEEGFKNAKHRQQWRNTLSTYAGQMAGWWEFHPRLSHRDRIRVQSLTVCRQQAITDFGAPRYLDDRYVGVTCLGRSVPVERPSDAIVTGLSKW
ncbi:hypothetical protein [Sphingobium nicotianae]|uniref:Uncharacterized protein n=1 Tax=Sphingobium nicotianae TaxID=2782607 RepID=A0A9X1DAC7_9SPHN|nr:hypothetical protein [Sphingobium nicotianae]MBT2186319.1 hypothetical protein [Sphingobium nicotianae]